MPEKTLLVVKKLNFKNITDINITTYALSLS